MAEKNPTSNPQVAPAVAPETQAKTINTATAQTAEAPRSINAENLSQAEQKQQNIAPNADTVGANPINQPVHEQSPVGNPPKAMSIEEINDKVYQGKALTVEEQKFKKSVEDEQKGDPKTASVGQKKDSDIAASDVEREKFEGKDVIEYMWQHWIIDGALWADEKIRKYAYYGKDRAWLAYKNYVADKEANKKTETYTQHNSIKDLHEKKQEELEKLHDSKQKEIEQITTAIKDGTLALPDNSELFNKYKEFIKADTPEGQEKLAQTLAACQAFQSKKDPQSQEEKIEFQKARATSAKVSANFYSEATINETFDTMSRMAANDLTAATMLDGIAKQKDMYPKCEESYEKIMASKLEDITKATQKDRELAIIGGPKFSLSAQEEAKNVWGGIATVQMRWEATPMGRMQYISAHSAKAYKKAADNIDDGKTAEMGKEPEENKPLKRANESIRAGIEGYRPQQMLPLNRAEETRESAQQAVEDLHRQNVDNGKPLSLEDTAKMNAAHDANADATMAGIQAKEDEIIVRETAHQAQGQKLSTHPMMAKFYPYRQQQDVAKAIEEGKKNNFAGWKIATGRD